MGISEARLRFYQKLTATGVLCIDAHGTPSNADDGGEKQRQKGQTASVRYALGIFQRIQAEVSGSRLSAQSSGSKFEHCVAEYLDETFVKTMSHIRPGKWKIRTKSEKPSPKPRRKRGVPVVAEVARRGGFEIYAYDQYMHLGHLESLAKQNIELASVIGNDYVITPDVVITREAETDDELNSAGALVDQDSATLASLRRDYGARSLLHASISCKWTIRSDRVQNARTEALNLIRNRKGRVPHIAVVTGDPLPARLAAIALGTGDIDCVYHFALPELIETVAELDTLGDTCELLETMTKGRRLKDISDLPLDLAV